MVKNLTRINDGDFKEYYCGVNGNKMVYCILDDNCVRYIGFRFGKRATRREYGNDQKDMCMDRAVAWLNK